MAEVTGIMPKPAVAVQPATPQAQPAVKTSDPSKTAGSIAAVGAPFMIKTQHQKDPWLKMLIYGKHGSGKTLLAGSAVDVEQMRDVLVINAESGDKTIHSSNMIKNADKILDVHVGTFKTVARVQEFLKAHCKMRDSNDEAGLRKLQSMVTGVPAGDIETPMKIKTVIIDSLTEIESYCMYGLLNIDNSKIVDDDIEVAQFAEFRKNNEMVKLLVRAFRDLPMNVIFVCAEQYNQDERKAYHYSPAMTGKLAAQIQGFMDMVGWLVVGAATEGNEAPRRLYVQPISTGPKFDAKNRLNTYQGSSFDNPTMEKIMRETKLLK